MTEVGEDALGMFTVPEAAVLMRLGRRTVWRMVASGEIESVKMGRSRRIPRQAVADYQDRLRKAAAHSHAAEASQSGAA